MERLFTYLNPSSVWALYLLAQGIVDASGACLTVLDKNCFVKSPGRYSLVPLPQGMVILRGSLNFLSRAGSFLAFLILSLCYFIFFGFPKSVVFRTKLLEIKINIFHGSSYACMAEQHLEFLHIKTLTHVVASKWRRLWG
jgi:hypothetical protein